MKTIYTFTLKGDDYPSKNFDSNLRLVAHILYEAIYNYDGDDNVPLNINDSIEYNNINEDYVAHIYRFNSDLYDDGYTDYEPFVIGDSSFGITISDESFTIDTIKKLVEETLRLLQLGYSVDISSVSYFAKDINDETNRASALKAAYEKLGLRYRRNSLIAMIMRNGKHNRKSSRRR